MMKSGGLSIGSPGPDCVIYGSVYDPSWPPGLGGYWDGWKLLQCLVISAVVGCAITDFGGIGRTPVLASQGGASCPIRFGQWAMTLIPKAHARTRAFRQRAA